MAIPDAAIVEESGQPVAFVQVSGETFQKRELTLGIRAGNWVQVLSGVAEGERVVTKGATEILPRADTVLKAAEARYSAGDMSLTEVLPVRRDWAAVQLTYLESLRDVMQAWAALTPYLRNN